MVVSEGRSWDMDVISETAGKSSVAATRGRKDFPADDGRRRNGCICPLAS